VLDQGVISPTKGTVLGSSVYEFTVDYEDGSATKLVLEATAYDSGNGPNRTSNNSDYSIVALKFTPQQSNCAPTNARVERQASVLSLDSPALLPEFQTTLFPNPAQESVTLIMSSATSSERDISVYDIRGVLKIQKTIPSLVESMELPLEQLEPGLYFIQIQGIPNVQRLIKR